MAALFCRAPQLDVQRYCSARNNVCFLSYTRIYNAYNVLYVRRTTAHCFEAVYVHKRVFRRSAKYRDPLSAERVTSHGQLVTDSNLYVSACVFAVLLRLAYYFGCVLFEEARLRKIPIGNRHRNAFAIKASRRVIQKSFSSYSMNDAYGGAFRGYY